MKKLNRTLIVSGLIVVAPLTFNACSRHDHSTHAHEGSSAQPKPYPLQTCIVSDERLGSMGEPVTFVHAGQEIKLCCKSCRPDFDKEPTKYLAKLNDGAKK